MVSKYRREWGKYKKFEKINLKKFLFPINILDNNSVYHFDSSSHHLDHLFRPPMMGLEIISFRIQAARMFHLRSIFISIRS